jgi:hypothetical protein
MDPRQLCGRVEKCYIENATKNQGATSVFDNQSIYVVNGANYVGQECLVRFDSIQHGMALPLANFLTSQLDGHPDSLPKEDYILYALWREGIFRTNRAPTMQEIERYYNPGKKSCVLFISKMANSRRGKFRINHNNQDIACSSFSKCIRDLPNPQYSARLVVAEGEEQLQKVRTAIEGNGWVPILLEAMKYH